MTDPEFKTQVFKEPKQWQSGLFYRLQMPETGGVVLAAMPAVSCWIDMDGISKKPACLATDQCGQIYFINTDDCFLYRYDPVAGRMERIPCFGGRGSDPGQFKSPARMIIGRHTLWVVDTGNDRIQAFARENLQLKHLIDDLAEPIDMTVSGDGRLYVLDRVSRQIWSYDANGRERKQGVGADLLRAPVACALGKDNILFVIDKAYDAFLRFGENGVCLGKVGDFTKVAAEFKPSVICIDGSGNIYVGDATVGGIHRFAADGSYLGTVSGFSGPVAALALDRTGDLYAAAGPQALALLTTDQRYSREQALYYSKTLDSGIQQCQWHRLVLQAAVPPRTTLEVYYYSSDDETLKVKVDDILSDQTRSTQEKKDAIDGLIPEKAWSGPEHDPADMLFREKTGRYLWLKLSLSTFDDTVTPSIAGMRGFYPRTSYLRYLPAIYQEDPVSKKFLERFLSLFESFFFDLETEISRLNKCFDPQTDICQAFKHIDCSAALPGFLQWLASWLNIALEEQWPTEKKRRLIAEAYHLYTLKGTTAGIKRLVEIYTGKVPRIMEHGAMSAPLILGKGFRLGINSIVTQTPIRGFRLGDDSILGRVALRDEAYSPADPFQPLAHRFTVILDLSEADFGLYRDGLVKLLNAEKPADTSYHLRIIKETGVGMDTYVGINTRVDGYRAMKIGVDSILGSNLTVIDNDEPCGKVERRSAVGKDTRLH